MRIQVFLGAEHYVQISQLYAVLQRKRGDPPPHFSWETASHREQRMDNIFPKHGLVILPGPQQWWGLWLWVFTLETRPENVGWDDWPWTPAGQGVRAGQKASREQAREGGSQTSRRPSPPPCRPGESWRGTQEEEGPGSRSRQLGWETATDRSQARSSGRKRQT